jgi:hypothetical protein
MELVTILRELWRQRIAVALSALVAILIGTVVAFHVSTASPHFKSRQYTIGLGTAHMLVDTPASQTVDIKPTGDTPVDLFARASLLANLMGSRTVSQLIAQRAGLLPTQLRVITPAVAGAPDAALPSATTPDPDGLHGVSTLTVSVSDGLPIISVNAESPDADRAAQLANAGVAGLQDYLKSVAATQKVPDAKRVVVSTFGPAQSGTVTRGPRRLFAIVAVLFVFMALCAMLLIVSGIARGWRRAALYESLADREDQDAADRDEPVELADVGDVRRPYDLAAIVADRDRERDRPRDTAAADGDDDDHGYDQVDDDSVSSSLRAAAKRRL